MICWNFSEIELKWRIPETHSAGDMVRRLIIAKSEADFTSHAGLGLIGMAISQHTDLAKDATAAARMFNLTQRGAEKPMQEACCREGPAVGSVLGRVR